MNKVYACIDRQASVTAVTDWAIWAARRLDVPLGFVHVMQPAATPGPGADIGGVVGLAGQGTPLEELATLDEPESRHDEELGQRLLAAACEQAAAAGLVRHDRRLRHGELDAVALDLEGDARLFVVGQHTGAGATSHGYLEHPVERLVRAAHRPVLVVPGRILCRPSGR